MQGSRLSRFGHVERGDCDYVGNRMLRLELPGKRTGGKPKKRFMDAVVRVRRIRLDGGRRFERCYEAKLKKLFQSHHSQRGAKEWFSAQWCGTDLL